MDTDQDRCINKNCDLPLIGTMELQEPSPKEAETVSLQSVQEPQSPIKRCSPDHISYGNPPTCLNCNGGPCEDGHPRQNRWKEEEHNRNPFRIIGSLFHALEQSLWPIELITRSRSNIDLCKLSDVMCRHDRFWHWRHFSQAMRVARLLGTLAGFAAPMIDVIICDAKNAFEDGYSYLSHSDPATIRNIEGGIHGSRTRLQNLGIRFDEMADNTEITWVKNRTSIVENIMEAYFGKCTDSDAIEHDESGKQDLIPESKPFLTPAEAAKRMTDILASDPSLKANPPSVRKWKTILGAGSHKTILEAMRTLGINRPKSAKKRTVNFSSTLAATIGSEDCGTDEIDTELDRQEELKRLLKEDREFMPSPFDDSSSRVYSKKKA